MLFDEHWSPKGFIQNSVSGYNLSDVSPHFVPTKG